MIFKYSIANFKSIYNSETIFFKAHPLKRAIKPIKNDLLSTIAIFGPNGGGKSSVLHSISWLIYLLNNDNQNIIFFNSFLNLKNLNNSPEIPIKWKLELVDNDNPDIILCYELEINKDGIQFEQFSTYELNNAKKPTIYFTRNSKDIEYNKKFFKGITLNFEISKPTLLINFINNFQNIGYIPMFLKLSRKIITFDNYNIKPFLYITPSIHQYNFNIEYLITNKNLFLKIFKDLDLNINDILLKKDIYGNPILILVKNGVDKEFEMSFELESEGTKKIIQLLVLFIMNINNDSVFVIDEFDTNLHTKLIQYLIQLFHTKKINTNSQLIFSSHDMELLSSKILREDEIYFAALNENYFSNLVSLVEFKGVRINNNFAKKYLNSEFGYDPYIDKGMSWVNEKK